MSEMAIVDDIGTLWVEEVQVQAPEAPQFIGNGPCRQTDAAMEERDPGLLYLCPRGPDRDLPLLTKCVRWINQTYGDHFTLES